MNITSESRILSSVDINRLLSLLHPVYHNLNFKIEFYETEETCLNENWNWLGEQPVDERFHFMGCVDSYVAFAYLEYNRLIFIEEKLINDLKNSEDKIGIPYEKLDKRIFKIYMIYTLFHEIRHAWQSIYKSNSYKIDDEIIYENSYLSLPYERDADRFASRMMNQFKPEINKLCGINYDWNWIHEWVCY